MVGGRGWDNSDYLSGLSGEDEDREKAAEDYQDFSERRKAFMERQQEIMKTPQGQAFLEQQQQRNKVPMDDFGSNDGFEDDLANITPNAEGATRMAQMMAQAKRMQRMQQGGGGMIGFEQKFAVPLDDDEDEDED